MYNRLNNQANRQLIVRFSHKNFLTSIKLSLNPPISLSQLQNNLSSLQAEFCKIQTEIIVQKQQKQLLQGLNYVMKGVFIKEYHRYMKQESNINNANFLGNKLNEHLSYFLNKCQRTFNPIKTIIEIKNYLQRSEVQQNIICFIKNNLFFQVFRKLLDKIKDKDQQIFVQVIIRMYDIAINKIYQIKKQDPKREEGWTYLVKQAQNILTQCLKIIKYNQIFTNQTCESVISIIINMKKIMASKEEQIKSKQNNTILTSGTILTYLLKNVQIKQPESNRSFSLLIVFILEFNTAKDLKIVVTILNFIFCSLQQATTLSQLLLITTNCINHNFIRLLQNLQKKIKTKQYKINDCVKTQFKQWGDIDNNIQRIRPNQKQFNLIIKQAYKLITSLKTKFQTLKQGKIDYTKFKKINNNNSQSKQQILSQSILINQQEQISQGRFSITSFLQTNGLIKSIQQEQKLQNYDILLKELQNLKDKIKQKQDMINQLQSTIGQLISNNKQCNCYKPLNKIYRIHEIDYKIDLKIKDITQQKDNVSKLQKFRQSLNLLPPPPPLSVVLKLNQTQSTTASLPSNFILPPLPTLLPQQTSLDLPSFLLPQPPSIPAPPPLLEIRKSKKRMSGKVHPETKTFGWTTVDFAKIKNSFWEEIKEPILNEKQILECFGKSQNKSSSNFLGLTKQNSIKSLLKPDRAKNIEIVLKKLKLNPQKLVQIVVSFNENYFNQLTIQCLLNIIPTEKENQIFLNVNILPSQKDQWTLADYYLSIVTKMDDYARRLRAIMHKFEYQNSYEHFFQLSNYFIAFFKGVTNDKVLSEFLKYLLSVGNYLNANSYRGGAYGVKLDSIQKSYTLIGQDHITSLFDFILKCVWRDSQNIDELQKQVMAYRTINVTVISVSNLKDQFNQLKKQYQNIQQCLVNIHQDNQVQDKVTLYLLSTYQQIKQNLNLSLEKINEADQLYKYILQFYCEKSQSQKIFEIVRKFREKVLEFIKKQGKKDIQGTHRISNPRWSLNN